MDAKTYFYTIWIFGAKVVEFKSIFITKNDRKYGN